MWRIFCSLLLTVCFQRCFWCFWRFRFHLDTSGFLSWLIIDQNDCQIYSGQCRLPWGESSACGHGDCLDHVVWLGSPSWKWILSVLGFRTSLHEKEENELSTNINSLLLTVGVIWPAASGSYCLDLSLLMTVTWTCDSSNPFPFGCDSSNTFPYGCLCWVFGTNNTGVRPRPRDQLSRVIPNRAQLASGVRKSSPFQSFCATKKKRCKLIGWGGINHHTLDLISISQKPKALFVRPLSDLRTVLPKTSWGWQGTPLTGTK